MTSEQLPLYSYATVDAPSVADDAELVKRIANSYRVAQEQFHGHGSSFWRTFEDKHGGFEAAINAGDLNELGRLLRTPSETELFWGFDDLVKSFVDRRNTDANSCRAEAQVIYNAVIETAIGSGAIRCNFPEANQERPKIEINSLIDSIEQKFGFPIKFPNPFKHEFGLVTKRGILSCRAAQALYQAWRVKKICDFVGGSRALEIGAGLGRNAYFARCFGVKNYTIVDIPRTQLAQSYYLGRVLGKVSLSGEDDEDVRIRSPRWLLETNESFDVVLNVDSMTELDSNTAKTYIEFTKQRSKAFLSINHEANPCTVDELLSNAGITSVHRSPYWPRAGYVEELCLMNA